MNPMKTALSTIAALLLALALASPAQAAKRMALVIGNAEYRYASRLANPLNDAADTCVSAGGCSHRPGDEGWGHGQRPVMNSNWYDAKEYVRWPSRRTGKRYRLLSEAEWEYAARAGARTAYSWGDYTDRNRANFDGCGSRWDDDRTAPVGSLGANRFGLYDMHGNVWEWVEDCWYDNYRGAPSDGRAWKTGGDCGRRVLRGGSWIDYPGGLRAASRIRNTAGSRNNLLGFRVARTRAP